MIESSADYLIEMKDKKDHSAWQNFVLFLGALCIGIGIGAVMGSSISKNRSRNQASSHPSNKSILPEVMNLPQDMIAEVSAASIQNYLRYLSAKPHIAGTSRDNDTAMWTKQKWLEAGIDEAELVPYRVLLSYPHPDKPNQIYIMNEGNIEWESTYLEDIPELEGLTAEEIRYMHSFHGYSPAGEIEGDLVYVNHGHTEDFEELKKLGIDVTGRICIMRHGRVGRGTMVLNCASAGGLAAIIFSDPVDVAPFGTDDVYPKTLWIPEDGMQRGNTQLGIDGDPLTPGYASLDGAYRFPMDEVNLPPIPSQPIGYGDARVLLSKLGGPSPPENWIGMIQNISYNIGPGFAEEYGSRTVKVKVHNVFEERISLNVIGKVFGSVEPDRWVLIGNHRDALMHGAMDPSSGSAQLMETVRVIGDFLARGWRPRRTLIFCSWGAEEFGLIGSTEFVEEYVTELQDKAVAYLNTDTCSSGELFQAGGSPQLQQLVRDVAKLVPSVHEGYDSLYHFLKEYHQNFSSAAEPVINRKSVGTDHTAFIFYAGVPILDYVFKIDPQKYSVSRYPAYHMLYETLAYYEKFTDPEYKYVRGCGQMAIATIQMLADASILPFDIIHYGEEMSDALASVKTGAYAEIIQTEDINLDYLEAEISNFKQAAENLRQKLLTYTDETKSIVHRMLNDQLMSVEKSLILPEGLPDLPYTRHAYFAPSKSGSISGLPGLLNLLDEYEKISHNEKSSWKQRVDYHVTKLMILTHQAANRLKPLTI